MKRQLRYSAPLIDPAKLDTLKGERAATPRLRRIMYWLRLAQRDGFDPATLIDEGQKANRSGGTERAKLIKESLLRNLDNSVIWPVIKYLERELGDLAASIYILQRHVSM